MKTSRTDEAEEMDRLSYEMSREAGDPPYSGGSGILVERARMMEQDTERLNWLQENQITCFTWTQDDPFGEPTRKLWQCDNVGLEKARDNIRDAIDAAREDAKDLSSLNPDGSTRF